MASFVNGPLVWLAFLGFFGGIVFKLVTMAREARREKTVLPTLDFKYGTRSIRHWMIPFAATNMRKHPVMTLVSFGFHACLILAPLFAVGHAVMWEKAWGFSWWSLPDGLTHLMAGLVVLGGGFFILRRIMAPEVRNVTGAADVLLVLLVISPFATGFVAREGWIGGETMQTLHIVTGAMWLLAVPFTRLAHAIWFGLSRAFMGSEFGKVRHARDW